MASSSFSINKTLTMGQNLQSADASYEADTHVMLVPAIKVATNNVEQNYEQVGYKTEARPADYDNQEAHVVFKAKFKAGATETVRTETIYVEPDQLWIG